MLAGCAPANHVFQWFILRDLPAPPSMGIFRHTKSNHQISRYRFILPTYLGLIAFSLLSFLVSGRFSLCFFFWRRLQIVVRKRLLFFLNALLVSDALPPPPCAANHTYPSISVMIQKKTRTRGIFGVPHFCSFNWISRGGWQVFVFPFGLIRSDWNAAPMLLGRVG